MEIGPIVNLVKNILTFPGQIIAAICFSWLLLYARKSRFSPTMVIYIVICLVYCVAALPLTVYSFIAWRTDGPNFFARTLFLLGIPKYLAQTLFPTSFMFVGIERLLYVKFPMKSAKIIQFMSFIVPIGLGIQLTIISISLYHDYVNTPDDRVCYTYSCLIGARTLVIYLIARYTAAGLNVIVGGALIWFIRGRWAVRKTTNNASTSGDSSLPAIQKQNTIAIMRGMYVEFFVDFLPHLIAFFVNAFIPNQTILGPLPPVVTTTEITILGILYVKTLWKRLINNTFSCK